MVNNKDPNEIFDDIYGNYEKEKLLNDGKQFLESNLKIKSKKASRIFWTVFWVLLLVGIWIGILSIVYLLERSNIMAESFERSREKSMRQYDDNGE